MKCVHFVESPPKAIKVVTRMTIRQASSIVVGLQSFARTQYKKVLFSANEMNLAIKIFNQKEFDTKYSSNEYKQRVMKRIFRYREDISKGLSTEDLQFLV
jgi:hypothetical protein